MWSISATTPSKLLLDSEQGLFFRVELLMPHLQQQINRVNQITPHFQQVVWPGRVEKVDQQQDGLVTCDKPALHGSCLCLACSAAAAQLLEVLRLGTVYHKDHVQGSLLWLQMLKRHLQCNCTH